MGFFEGIFQVFTEVHISLYLFSFYSFLQHFSPKTSLYATVFSSTSRLLALYEISQNKCLFYLSNGRILSFSLLLNYFSPYSELKGQGKFFLLEFICVVWLF